MNIRMQSGKCVTRTSRGMPECLTETNVRVTEARRYSGISLTFVLGKNGGSVEVRKSIYS